MSNSAVFLDKQALNEDILETNEVSRETSISEDKFFLAKALPHYTDEKNIKLFEKHGVYTKLELESRKEILLEKYCQTINIEALTMLEMVKKDIIPAICNHCKSCLHKEYQSSSQ